MYKLFLFTFIATKPGVTDTTTEYGIEQDGAELDAKLQKRCIEIFGIEEIFTAYNIIKFEMPQEMVGEIYTKLQQLNLSLGESCQQ